jgi:hypothetical protein
MSEVREAARRGDLATIKRLVASNGASVTGRSPAGVTALITASAHGQVAIVKYLLARGASIAERSNGGFTALLAAALGNRFVLMQYLLEEAGACASIAEATNTGETVWTLLAPDHADSEPEELTSLLKVMVMLDDAPQFFIAALSPAHTELTTRGRQYRAQLPLYLEQQRALIAAHCPLPAVLQPFVAAYAATIPDDMWTDGLRVSVQRAKRPRAAAGAEDEAKEDVAMPLRRSLRLRQKRA